MGCEPVPSRVYGIVEDDTLCSTSEWPENDTFMTGLRTVSNLLLGLLEAALLVACEVEWVYSHWRGLEYLAELGTGSLVGGPVTLLVVVSKQWMLCDGMRMFAASACC